MKQSSQPQLNTSKNQPQGITHIGGADYFKNYLSSLRDQLRQEEQRSQSEAIASSEDKALEQSPKTTQTAKIEELQRLISSVQAIIDNSSSSATLANNNILSALSDLFSGGNGDISIFNLQDAEGNTLLHKIVQNFENMREEEKAQSLKIVKEAIKKGADISIQNNQGDNILHEIAKNDNHQMLQAITEVFQDLDKGQNSQEQLQQAKTLGRALSVVNRQNQTPLRVAVTKLSETLKKNDLAEKNILEQQTTTLAELLNLHQNSGLQVEEQNAEDLQRISIKLPFSLGNAVQSVIKINAALKAMKPEDKKEISDSGSFKLSGEDLSKSSNGQVTSNSKAISNGDKSWVATVEAGRERGAVAKNDTKNDDGPGSSR